MMLSAVSSSLKRHGRSPAQTAIIRRLHKLADNRGRQSIYGERKYRVEFLSLAFIHGLDRDIIDYKLWDEGFEGLGERQWDTCFEMGDSEDVIAEVVDRARKEGFLDAIESYCNPEGFQRWLNLADRQASLF